MIDEFIYQFESFCRYRNRVARTTPNEPEAQVLRENPNTWGCYSVLNVLYSLIQRSQINEQLAAQKRNEDPMTVAGDYGSRPLYRMLGYFSIIGLLRVHCLLGDFSLALKTLDDIEMNKKAMFARVMAAHFTTYYYVGFSYMMLRRYADAIRMFSHILVYVSRTKNFQKGSNSYDAIAKKNEQMYALIAICVAFPQPGSTTQSTQRCARNMESNLPDYSGADPMHYLLKNGQVRVWFGGGDRPSPDEKLKGQIGYATLRPVDATLAK